MHINQLERGKEYVSGMEKFKIDAQGYICIAKQYKRNGIYTWFDCNYTYNKLNQMEFELRDPQCKHKNEKNEYTIAYDDANEMRNSDMYCTQCNITGNRAELEKGYI